jgi:hypothetical protein
MRVSLKSLFAAGVVGAMGMVASAAPVAVSSTVAQSGFIGTQNSASYQLTSTPYDFTGQVNAFANVTGVDSITVSLTVNDGDTGVGEYDLGSLFLGLDGINTGLALNGFLNNNIVTLTLNTLNPATSALLAAALSDGQLVGTVIDTTPGNSTPAGDIIGFPSIVDTTLDLVLSGPNLAAPGGGPNPIPLPAAALIAPLGAGLAGMYSRRFRKAK